MENPYRQIKGYRELSKQEIKLVNEGRALAEQCREYIDKLMALEETDKRAVVLGKTNLQQGFTWALRSVVQPTTI